MNDLRSFISSMQNGTFFTLVAETEPKMNKRNNTYYGRVTKRTTLTSLQTGVSYENCCGNALVRNGKDGEYQSDKPFGKSWDIPNKVLVSDKDNSQLYFRVCIKKSSIAKSVYYLDGVEITDNDIMAEIKSFMPKPSECKKQAEAGLEGKEQIVVRDYKFQSIIEIRQGNKVWSK